ncbi:hypothetical protein [Gilvimarinus sp. DA14]|uniref:hypothetical protein n=1 Tax=Gilvimarinus sp. DA14 TaxID=2956798 RepID=UPI0020B6C914|nr:hypothetical protein [Gilvimarinus sp. DA14]UTF58564.1 hypothetical protein NHM04_08725 [Gilvimarinus sp. DA14]
MNLLLPPSFTLLLASLALALPALGVALRGAPWRQLAATQQRQHAFFAAILALGLFWLLQVEVRDSLGFHPMLMAVVTMIFGWHLALIIGALALVALQVYRLALWGSLDGWLEAWQGLNPAALPVDFVLSVVVPASWTLLVLYLVDRWSFKNPFTFFLGVGFFGAMLSCLWMGAAAFTLFYLTGSEAPLAVLNEHGLLFVLMMFPEGFCNGALATVFTILWPDMVKTYRDEWYLGD